MEKINELSLGEKLILGAGVLLFIDLFLHWQSYDLGPITLGRSGIHGFWGIFLFLFTIAIVALVGGRLFGVKLSENLPEGLIALVLGGLIVFFAVIKNISDDYSAWPAYVGVVLAALVAYGGWLVFKDSGESLPMSSSSSGSTSPPAAAPPPPAPPSEPPREPDAS